MNILKKSLGKRIYSLAAIDNINECSTPFEYIGHSFIHALIHSMVGSLRGLVNNHKEKESLFVFLSDYITQHEEVRCNQCDALHLVFAG